MTHWPSLSLILILILFPMRVNSEIHAYQSWGVVEGAFMRSIAITKSELNDVQMTVSFYYFACDHPELVFYHQNPHRIEIEETKKESIYKLRVDENDIYNLNWSVHTDSLASNMIGHFFNSIKQDDGQFKSALSVQLISELKKGLFIRTKLEEEINRFSLSGFTKAYNHAESLCRSEKEKLDAIRKEDAKEKIDDSVSEETFYDSNGNLIKGK
jgi:hypothetical protein